MWGLRKYYETPGGRMLMDTLDPEDSLARKPDAEDRRGAIHPHPGYADHQRRSHAGSHGYHRTYVRQRGDREGHFKVRAAIETGRTIVDPLRETGVFPNMVVQMIGVGEQTGALDAMLAKVADFYEDEVDAAVGDLLTAMEPMIILMLGVVVGGVVISMYLPLFSLIGKLAG